jgi:steroid delta-isomerase-like uncharacterized protein
MTPDEWKARARRLPDELLTQGDLAVADELLAADCRHHAPAPLAPGGEGLKRWVAALRRAFPDLCAIVEDEVAEGDTVVQRLTLSGTHEGACCGMLPTGRRASWQVVAILHLNPDGKITEQWILADLLGVLRQIGALPLAADRRREAADAAQGS